MTIVHQLEPRAIVTADRLPDLLYSSFQGLRTAARLVGALGLLTLFLSAAGVWGTVSYVVEQRRREIGIRMALGAKPQQAVAALLNDHVPACAIGLFTGILLAVICSRAMEHQLYGVRALDPIAYAGALGLVTLVGVSASVLPAVRTIRSDSHKVLRSQ
jgi:ABC-type antimicrobial peptide transport system permease subunit